MFDLGQSIANWRKEMIAAGIKPESLDELEIHLREEIEEQIKLGANEEQAFEIAVQRIGQAGPLKTEFKNAGFANCWGEDKNARINRGFALLWLAYCSWGFFSLVTPFLFLVSAMIQGSIVNDKFWLLFGGNQGITLIPDLLLVLLFEVIFLRGIIAAILLFDGKNNEIRTIRFIAILGLLAFAAQIISFKNFICCGLWYSGAVFAARTFAFRDFFLLAIASVAFNVASLWLLRSPLRRNLKTETT